MNSLDVVPKPTGNGCVHQAGARTVSPCMRVDPEGRELCIARTLGRVNGNPDWPASDGSDVTECTLGQAIVQASCELLRTLWVQIIQKRSDPRHNGCEVGSQKRTHGYSEPIGTLNSDRM